MTRLAVNLTMMFTDSAVQTDRKNIGCRVRNKLQLLSRTHRPAGGRTVTFLQAVVTRGVARASLTIRFTKATSYGAQAGGSAVRATVAFAAGR